MGRDEDSVRRRRRSIIEDVKRAAEWRPVFFLPDSLALRRRQIFRAGFETRRFGRTARSWHQLGEIEQHLHGGTGIRGRRALADQGPA